MSSELFPDSFFRLCLGVDLMLHPVVYEGGLPATPPSHPPPMTYQTSRGSDTDSMLTAPVCVRVEVCCDFLGPLGVTWSFPCNKVQSFPLNRNNILPNE